MKFENNTLFNFASWTLIATSLIYVTGWVYAFYYFQNYKIGLLTLDIPSDYYFMYGFWVFKDKWYFLLILFPLVTIIYQLPMVLEFILTIKQVSQSKKPECNYNCRDWLLPPIVMLLLILLYIGALYMGKKTADDFYKEDARNFYPGNPLVKVWLKPTLCNDPDFKDLYAELPKGNYRLLLQNSDKLFLFYADKMAKMPVIEISMSDVAGIKIFPTL